MRRFIGHPLALAGVLGAIGIGAGALVLVAVQPERAEAVLGKALPVMSANGWSMTVVPPELVDPLEFVIGADLKTNGIGDFDQVGCEGRIYRIDIPSGRDARVSMDPAMPALEYPVWITGGRNVRVIGLEMRPIVQAGCDVGEAHQMKDSRPNIHPRLVSGKLLRVEQSGTTFIEGLDMDLAGMEADCIVARNPDEMQTAEALVQRRVAIVNTRCVGIEGLDDSPVGDGIHGDFFQNQGDDDIETLVLENVTILSSSNGITLHAWNGRENRTRTLRMRNLDYGWDERYDDDDPHEISGLVFTASAVQASFENVWIDDPRGLNYGILDGQRLGAEQQGDTVRRWPGLNAGKPPGGPWAPGGATGLQYRSPF